ncbi:phosphoribosylaminoimidazolesuccinocarboxamide synthase [Candidatus Saccharibacteria bacterium]|nr:phosphoribosylaminoimidazolesuccinocarboxamide synthase [Candidatus Saccharibacteria bacterium]
METPQPIYRGKVRDTYAGGSSETLVVVASDRISVFDVVLDQLVPGKGVVLTHMTEHWLTRTPVADVMTNHLISASVHDLPDWIYVNGWQNRTLLVRRAQMLLAEFVVRGYITGSAWKEYQRDGVVSGITLPTGLREMERFPEPIFTPSTKATSGHDENIDFEGLVWLLGDRDLAEQARRYSLELYQTGAAYARQRGIILVDTKFEFGLIDGRLMLCDEVLTPDSSRYVHEDDYEPGKPPASYDKQIVRDAMAATGWDKKPPPPPIPGGVIEETVRVYGEIAEQLTGTNPLAASAA